MLTTKPTHSKPAPTTTARDYTKVYVKLLTAVANAPKAVDNYFFDADDDASDEIRPYFYGGLSCIVAIVLFVYVAIN